MKNVYVSILSSDSYLVGLLVMWASLQKQSPKFSFLVLISREVSEKTLHLLKRIDINFMKIPEIKNPHITDTNHIFNSAFDKLNVFNLIKFQKIVYIDADILVVDNIDELFDAPSMSAVNSGGELPSKKDWKQLNAGMLVIEPSTEIFNDMLSKINTLPSKDGSDQGFLHSYFYDWENISSLHLDQGYNMFSGFLNEFHSRLQYDFKEKKPTKTIKMIHFWSDYKPWIRGRKFIDKLNGLESYSNFLWWKTYDEMIILVKLLMEES